MSLSRPPRRAIVSTKALEGDFSILSYVLCSWARLVALGSLQWKRSWERASKTLAEAFELGSWAPDMVVKSYFFCFLEMDDGYDAPKNSGRHTDGDDLEVFNMASTCFRRGLLQDVSTEYNVKVWLLKFKNISRMLKHVTAPMRLHLFDLFIQSPSLQLCAPSKLHGIQIDYTK